MKKMALIFIFLLASCTVHNEKKPSDNTERLIVTYSEGAKKNILAEASRAGLPVVYDLKNMNIIVLDVPAKNIENEMSRLEKLDGVLAVNKDSSEITLQ